MREALKLALDLAIMHHSDDGYAELRSKVRQLAKEALAQPEQKRPQNCGTGYCSCIECVMEPEQEPVAWGYRSKDGEIYDCISPEAHADAEGDYTVPLYTTPPKREPHNFCPRCGKRLIGMAFAAGGIHTCTPPEGEHK